MLWIFIIKEQSQQTVRILLLMTLNNWVPLTSYKINFNDKWYF